MSWTCKHCGGSGNLDQIPCCAYCKRPKDKPKIDDFDPNKRYGQMIEVSDAESWQLLARLAASRVVPTGTKIIVAKNKDSGVVGWRYPPHTKQESSRYIEEIVTV